MFGKNEAQAFLADAFAPWVQALDLTVDEIDPEGRAVVSMPITADIARMGGIVCGQSLATLADTAMVLSTAAHFGAPRDVATTNLDTQFLSAGRGARIRCTARITRAGRSLIFAQADLVALPDGKPVASASATFFVPEKAPR
ncbi:PaaI family thioesterase [Seohaeicola saemankumensis]|uniref:PaaI family thioesterase n=1 Tax=Seohaeicola saemankumensis TaxID=481181 RepID=A0ABW3T8U8_9RHOB|nr:PaaI family thioesterase [Paracoccaceae bacterium]